MSAVTATTLPTPVSAASLVDPTQLAVLTDAASANERVRFNYHNHDAVTTRRLLEPHRLVVVGRRWYLLAYDNNRADWRTFRLDRIERPQTTGIRVPPADDPAAFVTTHLYGNGDACLADHAGSEPTGPLRQRRTAIDGESCQGHSPEDTIDWVAARLTLLQAVEQARTMPGECLRRGP